MASYDKNKLLWILEQRRAAHLVLRDLGERLRDAKSDQERAKSALRRGCGESRRTHEFLDHLLKLPDEQAAGLTCDEVQGYERKVGNALETVSTGVNFHTWRSYLDARRKAERLAQQYGTAHADFGERFAIITRLRDAVRSWGFSDPEMEL